MNENLKKLEKLWNHAGVSAGAEIQSECMSAIKDVLIGTLSKKKPPFHPLLRLSERIGEHVGFEHHRQLMISRVKGEWRISHADLEFWGRISFFGNRDYFPNIWQNFAACVTSALYSKRRWQTLERYRANGGVNSEHRKLLNRLKWDLDFSRGDGVSLYVQGKRPFGNSSIEIDIIDIVGWEVDTEKDTSIETEERCWKLFDELQFAIVDALATNRSE